MTAAEFQDKLYNIISDMLAIPVPEITENTSPDNVPAWDSVAHLNLIVSLEESFNVGFSPDETMELTSVKIITLALHEKLGIS